MKRPALDNYATDAHNRAYAVVVPLCSPSAFLSMLIPHCAATVPIPSHLYSTKHG